MEVKGTGTSNQRVSLAELFLGEDNWRKLAGVFLLLCLLFGLAYAQAPLFTSNQNQYFLRGAALAGVGDLQSDWLVNTRDSTPVFSFLVYIVFRFLHPYVFHIIYALLLGSYLAALTGILRTQHAVSRRTGLVQAGLLFALHSAALRFVLSRIPGDRWEYLLEAGFAGQRLLGPVLQPSSFGVLLLISIFAYLRRRPVAAVLLAVLAATVHPTYLLSAASLTLAYMVGSLMEERSLRKPMAIGLAALAAVLPVLAYTLISFSPTSAGATREAQELLVTFRIPQHTQIGMWFDTTAVIKLVLIAASLVFTRRTRLFTVLLVPVVVMVLLTAAQAVLDSNQLALLFPWRLSTWLIPVSTAVTANAGLCWFVDRFAQRVEPMLEKAWFPAGVIAMAVLLALVGAVKFGIESHRKEADPANPMMAFVREHAEGDQLYMIPPKLQVFRLETGEPAMVEFKSIPYQDREVLEWYERIRLAQYFYRDTVEQISCDLLGEAAGKYGVTHVVLAEDQLGVNCSDLLELYRDDAYGVYRLSGE